MNAPPRRLATPEAADYLGISEVTLKRWRAKKIGPRWIKVGPRAVRYSVTELDKYLNANTVETTGATR